MSDSVTSSFAKVGDFCTLEESEETILLLKLCDFQILQDSPPVIIKNWSYEGPLYMAENKWVTELNYLL